MRCAITTSDSFKQLLEKVRTMPQVHWIMSNGDRISDDVNEGTNLMDAAQMNGISGVAGECGGCLSCATCHVYVDEAWLAACPPMNDVENAMLDVVIAPRQSGSRLSCQLMASAALDGIVLHVPD
jgi:2Fe-2S ferredoxin